MSLLRPAFHRLAYLLLPALLALAACSGVEPADSIYFNGHVITVDSSFTTATAVAIRGDRFAAVGDDKAVLEYRGDSTVVVDLDGRTVIPGLIEGHAHPLMAALSELDEPLPNPRTIRQLLGWIRRKAESSEPGEWIIHPKFFHTRLSELRGPTLAELDRAAPENPVFLDGSFGGFINTAAMKASGIDNSTRHDGLLRDPETGRLNGKLQYTAFGLLDLPDEPPLSVERKAAAVAELLDLYNRQGFTSVVPGDCDPGEVEVYRYMKDRGMLTLRVFMNIHLPFDYTGMTEEQIRQGIAGLGEPTGSGNEWLRTGALKLYMDGGILTGTAYLREPWGEKAREVYGVTDLAYRGIPRATADELYPLCLAAAEAGWKVNIHATGGGAVDIILDAYERTAESADIDSLRFSIIHGNFYNGESIERMSRLGIIADAQPAWFYKDADAMFYILGARRASMFNPFRSLLAAGVTLAAGSDHMVILDPFESINPYSPWLGIWSMVTRRTERGPIVAPEEALTRREALEAYTMGNACATFEEHRKGSIEPGKLADMAVLPVDPLTCPVERLRGMEVLRTVAGGKVVYDNGKLE